mgnify:CR=1 FL=1
MIIDNIREFIKECPLLENDKINVNYLGGDTVSYTIEQVPTNPLIKRYSDGGKQKQVLFIFASRENYDEDVLENMDVAKFYEEFAEWIEEQNESGNLPVLDGGMISQAMETLTSGYLINSEDRTARFQIQLRLIYYKPRA